MIIRKDLLLIKYMNFQRGKNKINMNNMLNLNNVDYVNDEKIKNMNHLSFLGEKNNRIRKKLLWKYHKELVSKDKLFYTDKDKALIRIV